MTSDLSAEASFCCREATFISLNNLEMGKRLGRVDFRKGFWDCYKGQGKINQCHDGDDNENVKKKNNNSLQVHHSLLYVSWPLLYDHDGKMTNFTFCGGHKQATAKFSFSF